MKKFHATKEFNLVPCTEGPDNKPNKIWMVEIHDPECTAIAYAVGETLPECKRNASYIVTALRQLSSTHN